VCLLLVLGGVYQPLRRHLVIAMCSEDSLDVDSSGSGWTWTESWRMVRRGGGVFYRAAVD